MAEGRAVRKAGKCSRERQRKAKGGKAVREGFRERWRGTERVCVGAERCRGRKERPDLLDPAPERRGHRHRLVRTDLRTAVLPQKRLLTVLQGGGARCTT